MNFHALRELLSHRNFAIYATANVISLIGTWIHRIAIGWLAWEYTHSPLWVGVIAASSIIPVLVMSLIGGVLADRVDHRRLIATSQFFAFVLMLALSATYRLDLLDVWLLIVFRVLLSTVMSISQPARVVLIPSLVPKNLLVTALSFGALSFNVARLVGPAVAALLLMEGHFGLAFTLNGISYLLLVGAMILIRIDEKEVLEPKEQDGLIKELGASVSYIRSHDVIRTFFLLFGMVALTCRPMTELIPAFVGAVFDRGIESVAILTSAMAVGSILGGLFSAGTRTENLVKTAVVSGALYGAGTILFVWTSNFWIAAFVLAFASALNVIFGVTARSVTLLSVDTNISGRVMGLWFVIGRAGPALGVLIIGTISEFLSLSLPFTAGGIGSVLIATYAWKRRQRILLPAQ